MRSTRYRLRFFTGATLTASKYGGGKFGDGTYGMQASDSLTTAHHRLVPWPAGAMTSPSWRYRQNDTMPDWQAQIIADDGVVSYTGMTSADLVLTAIDDPTSQTLHALTVDTQSNGDQRLRRTWNSGELNFSGVFRVAVVLRYSTGRHMTVPAGDKHIMVIHPDGS